MTRFAADWLTLREPADAAARATELVDPLRTLGPLTIRDLGCGTGSMMRWLSPLLPQPQQWTLTDRDPDLLAVAAETGAATELHDFTQLTAADLAGTTLVTGSAVLDILTEDEITTVVEACANAGCAALFTLSVVGRVALDPPNPQDADLMAAFNAHQRRTVDGRQLLGPDGIPVAAQAFERHGYRTTRAPSPWQLEPGPLLDEWLNGWTTAACEQNPELARHRRTSPTHARVAHEDLLALPHNETEVENVSPARRSAEPHQRWQGHATPPQP